jgi:hypothetical protein
MKGPSIQVPDPSSHLCLLKTLKVAGMPKVLRVTAVGRITDFVAICYSPHKGSIRRECPDHIVIFNEHHLRRILSCVWRIADFPQESAISHTQVFSTC